MFFSQSSFRCITTWPAGGYTGTCGLTGGCDEKGSPNFWAGAVMQKYKPPVNEKKNQSVTDGPSDRRTARTAGHRVACT